MKKLPIYKILIGEAEGIQKMSLVDTPAVESDFLKFEKQEEMKFSIDEEQHVVFGCALRCNYPIYRNSPVMGEYYVVFDADNINKMYEKFMCNPNKVNLQHQVDTNGVYLIQSFIKNTAKGINPVGFEDIEDFSWFCAYKVENEAVWEMVKKGEFNGFSIEGTFELEEVKEPVKCEKDLIDEILEQL